MFTFYAPWLTRTKPCCIVGQEGKSWDNKQFFYSKVIVLGSGTCCFTQIEHNDADFSVSFQSTVLLSISNHLLLKNYTTGFSYSWQKKVSSDREQGFYKLYAGIEKTMFDC